MFTAYLALPPHGSHSRGNLLRSAGLYLPAASAAIEAWLRDLGLHNLVIGARRDFAEVRFYLVASQAMPPGAADDPGAPLRWLLTALGARLPDDDSPAGIPGEGGQRPTAFRSRSGHARQDAREIPGEHAGAQG